jgi:hypothetical protein
MKVSHTYHLLESPALQRLGQFVREHERGWQSTPPSFEQFERAVHDQVMELERELLAAELARYEVDAEQIEVEGVRYHPVWIDTETYLTAAGEVQVERHLYRPAGHNAKSICPLELRVGILDGYWTPRAARQGAWVTAQLPPGDAEALFVELGAMSPSRSTLDRLPRDARSRNGARGRRQRGVLVGWGDGGDEGQSRRARRQTGGSWQTCQRPGRTARSSVWHRQPV